MHIYVCIYMYVCIWGWGREMKKENIGLLTHTLTHNSNSVIYICMYVCICVYVCMYACLFILMYTHQKHTLTNTHTEIHIYIYMYVYICVHICTYIVCLWMIVNRYRQSLQRHVASHMRKLLDPDKFVVVRVQKKEKKKTMVSHMVFDDTSYGMCMRVCMCKI